MIFFESDLNRDELTVINEILQKKSLKLFSIDVIIETVDKHNKNKTENQNFHLG